MAISKTVKLAVAANLFFAIGYALTARYAGNFESIAAWLYFGSAVAYLAAVVTDASAKKKTGD